MQYYLPTKIVIGRLEEEIRKEVDLFRPNKVLLVSSRSMEKAGVVAKIIKLLSGYEVAVFTEITQKPGQELVEKAKRPADLVIGIGGGSVLDVAKVAATEMQRPLIAIPTTAGTGSEATRFAALYDLEKKKKLSLDVNYPTVSLIDYRLTLTLPKEQVAATGLDALSQAIEAYWSIYSNPLSDTHAEKAIRLVMANLEESWRGNERAREMMALAALEAGLAFSQTKTTACHAVSYPLSIHYGVPHGLACGLTLPYFLTYNHQVSKDDCLDIRGAEFVRKRIEQISGFLGAVNPEKGEKIIFDLMKSIDLPVQIDFDVELVMKDAFAPERVANNPRRVTEDGLRKILKKIKL